jgi:uncharacterized protein DUF5681
VKSSETVGKQPKNLIGKSKPWKPGQSGNPKGRPRSAKFSEAMRELLKEVGDDGQTGAEKLAAVAMKKALSGSPRHLELAMAYVEGRPKQGIELSGPDGSALQFVDTSTEALLQKLVEMDALASGDPLHPLGIKRALPENLPGATVIEAPKLPVRALPQPVSEAEPVKDARSRDEQLNAYLLRPNGR